MNFKGNPTVQNGAVVLPKNTWGEIPGPMSFGRHFRIEIDARVTDIQSTCVFLDFNSFSQSDWGMGCALTNSLNRPNMNYKVYGNNGGEPYNFPPDSFPFTQNDVLYGIFEYGNQRYDNDSDILYFRYNRGPKIFGDNPHSVVMHDNFCANGQVHVNRGAIGLNYGTSTYTCDMTLREIKIYNLD